MSSKPESLFDKRIVERNIRNGRLTQKEYDGFLKRLQDARVKSAPLFEEPGSGDEASGNPDGESKN
jgi:hypothetical protein